MKEDFLYKNTREWRLDGSLIKTGERIIGQITQEMDRRLFMALLETYRNYYIRDPENAAQTQASALADHSFTSLPDELYVRIDQVSAVAGRETLKKARLLHDNGVLTEDFELSADVTARGIAFYVLADAEGLIIAEGPFTDARRQTALFGPGEALRSSPVSPGPWSI